jgi:hypothetical protein
MTLNLEAFDENSKKKSKTKYKAALGVGSVVSLFGIGSTLAANISLNGGGNVEFGQGVATTAACDEDGFSITPVTRYDNANSMFRIDYVQVSGVNLAPEGSIVGQATYSEAGVTDQDADSDTDQDDAKEQFPGQYYDVDEWKNTCDGVVLDFKAYTDDLNYIDRTVIDDGDVNSGSLQNPIGWYQHPTSTRDNASPGFALIIDMYDDGTDWDSNYAVDDSIWGDPNHMSFYLYDYATPAESSFEFYVESSSRDTDAASVSKITVQSMKEFPTTYHAYGIALGNPQQVYWTD